jgi:hypothetical protein
MSTNIDYHFAYTRDMHAVETVMRMHSVKRWHMIDTTRQQTLAEHSANVAMLIMLIASTAPMFTFGNPAMLAAAALVHDIPECFTGDIPTLTKRSLQGLESLEDKVTPAVFKMELAGDSAALLKMCDLADGIRFIRLHGVDATARHAREGLELQLRRKFDHADTELKWSEPILRHVRKHIMFYAYENH